MESTMQEEEFNVYGISGADLSDGFNMGMKVRKDALENEQYKQGHHFASDKVKLAADEIKARFRPEGYRGILGDDYYKGIGVNVEPGWDLKTKLEKADLDWDVETDSLEYGRNKQFSTVKDQIVYRSDNGERFCFTKDTWQPYQNPEVVNAFDEFCKGAGIEMERLGHIRGGRLVFASAVINDSWEVMGSDDVIAGRLLLTNSHVWGGGLTAKLLAVRLVCCNGITRKVSIGQRSISHNKPFSKNAVSAILESSKNNFLNLGLLIDQLAQVPIDNRTAKDFLVENLGDRDKESGSLKSFTDQSKLVRQSYYNFANHTSVGAHFEVSQRTAWELLNCITEQENHYSRSVGEKHIHSAWHGDKADKNAKVLSAMEHWFLNKKQKKAQTVGVRAF